MRDYIDMIVVSIPGKKDSISLLDNADLKVPVHFGDAILPEEKKAAYREAFGLSHSQYGDKDDVEYDLCRAAALRTHASEKNDPDR